MIVIVPFGYNHSGKYGIMGNGGLDFFSDSGFEGFTEGEMIKWLNTGTKTFVKNINDDFLMETYDSKHIAPYNKRQRHLV